MPGEAGHKGAALMRRRLLGRRNLQSYIKPASIVRKPPLSRAFSSASAIRIARLFSRGNPRNCLSWRMLRPVLKSDYYSDLIIFELKGLRLGPASL